MGTSTRRDDPEEEAPLLMSLPATSKSTAIFGLEHFIGQTIMALRTAMLCGRMKPSVEARLLDIVSQVRSEPPQLWPRYIIEELFDYQRNHFYAENIRLKSWDIILEILAKGGWAQVASVLRTWPSIEVQVFYRKLVLCKLSGWAVKALHPAAPSTRTLHATSSSQRQSLTTRSVALSQGLAEVLTASLKQDPALLHEMFTLDSFAVLHSNLIPIPWGGSDASLNMFFESLALCQPFYALPPETPATSIPSLLPVLLASFPMVECMTEFLRTGHSDNNKVMVDYILRSIKPYTYVYKHTMSQPSELLDSTATTIMHPTFPFLWFAIFVSYRHEEAGALFLAGGMSEIIQDIISNDFYIPLGGFLSPRQSKEHIYRRVVCYLLLYAIALHHDFDDDTSKLEIELEASLVGFRIADFTPSIPVLLTPEVRVHSIDSPPEIPMSIRTEAVSDFPKSRKTRHSNKHAAKGVTAERKSTFDTGPGTRPLPDLSFRRNKSNLKSLGDATQIRTS